MIFLVATIPDQGKIDVDVYDSLEDLSQRVEWQDILDDSLRILDEQGRIYVWDSSKGNEVGTVYDYSFKISGTDLRLAEKCVTNFIQRGQPYSFDIDC